MFDTQRQAGRNIPHYKQMMKRLLRGNIALVLVLEELGTRDSQGNIKTYIPPHHLDILVVTIT